MSNSSSSSSASSSIPAIIDTLGLNSSHINCSQRLIREYRDSKRYLPLYDHQLLRQIQEQSNELIESMTQCTQTQYQSRTAIAPQLKASILAQMSALQFHKRCVLSYLNSRTNRIRQIWWDSSGIIDYNQKQHKEVFDAMSEQERAFLNEYEAAVLELQGDLGIMLTESWTPPTSIWTCVRVIIDAGTVLGEDGSIIDLRQGSLKRMKRVDAERLIRQGLVIEI